MASEVRGYGRAVGEEEAIVAGQRAGVVGWRGVCRRRSVREV
jgi:hypothetical protein